MTCSGESKLDILPRPSNGTNRTRRCRLLEGKACGLGTNYTDSGFRVYRTELPGNEGAPSGEVSLLRSDGCQHAPRVQMPPSRCAGKPASVASPRTVPHLQAVHPPSSGMLSALQRRQEPPHGYSDREGRPPRRYVVRISPKSDTPPRRHACRPSSEGSHAG